MAQVDFLFHIVSTSGVPIYRQIMDQITAMIISGRLKPGTFLPSIREAGKELGINPMTVSKVYSILEREGIIENVRGQGMRVLSPSKTEIGLTKRKEMISASIKEVIKSAHRLNLEKKDILEMFDHLWEE